MSKKADEFVRLLTAKSKSAVKAQIVPALVIEVDKEASSMTAKGLVDDLEYFDVSLGLGNIIKTPKTGALCFLGVLNNKDSFTFLVDVEEVEEIKIKSDDSTVIIKKEGIQISKGNESLSKILSDFMDEVNKIFVVNGTTVNVPAVNLIKTRLNSLLK